MKAVRWICGVSLAAVMCLAGVAYSAGVRTNWSASMPRGLYREVSTSGDAFPVGDIVTACPVLTEGQKVYLDPGVCPSGMEPILKPVVAAAGDTVQVSAAGVAVNGRLLPFTAPLTRDGAGRPLQPFPAGTYAVGPRQVWLVVPLAYSFDSRYLGPISTDLVLSSMRPVLTWR